MASTTVKAYKGMGMEGMVAKWYATNTRKSIDEFKALARRVAGELSPGSTVLEVAPGPGYFAIELARLGDYCITGLDISETFVAIARKNAAEARVAVDFQQGNVAAMPFSDSSFDFLLCRAAFKNFSEPVRALQEMYRVLKPGGQALIIDLRRDATQSSVNELVDGMGMNALNRVMTKLTFRFMLLKRAYTRREFEHFFSQTNFRQRAIEESLTGLEIRAVK
jgi:ubiquinone/menaquinone biosynthesis C-methylase UbiE